MKHHYLVVVADGAGARIFTLDSAPNMTVESGPRLVECADMINTEHRLHGRDKYSTTRPDYSPNTGGGPIHGYDDHRERQDREHDRQFAAMVAERSVALALEYHATHLVIVAEKRMLGLMRDAVKLPAKSGIAVSELASDLVRFAPDHIQAHLVTAGLLPAHHRIGVV